MGRGYFSITCEFLKKLLRLPVEVEIVEIGLDQHYATNAINIHIVHSDLSQEDVRVMPTYRTPEFTGWNIIEEEEE